MSKTILYWIDMNGDVRELKGFQNSHRGADLFWGNLYKKYIGDDYIKACFKEGGLDPLWNLYKDKEVPECLRILLASTFDYIVIRGRNIPRFIEANREALREKYLERYGHFEEYPSTLEEALQEKDLLGICWNQTDTCVGVWRTDIYDKNIYLIKLKNFI